MTQARAEQFSVVKNSWDTILFSMATNQRAVAIFKQVPPNNATVDAAIAAITVALNEARRQALIVDDELNSAYTTELP